MPRVHQSQLGWPSRDELRRLRRRRLRHLRYLFLTARTVAGGALFLRARAERFQRIWRRA